MDTDPKKTSYQKVPPHNEIAEKSVLGAMLIDQGAVTTVIEKVRPEHFYFDEHKLVYEAALALFEKNKPIDVVTVGAQLKEAGTLKRIGGSKYLSELIDAVPTSAYIEHYAEIVKASYLKRSLITMASKLVEKSFDEEGDIKELLDRTESELFGMSQSYLHKDFIHLKEVLAESFERLEEFMKSGAGGLRGVPTGYTDLDNKLAGMQDSNLIILAARPGMGKTTFALNIALNVAFKYKMPVGMFSLEMSKEELVDRLLVGQADIDAWKLKTGRLSDNDYTKLTQAMGDLADAPIYIDDTPGATILEMRTKIRKLAVEKGVKLVIIDYLQLASPGKKIENRVQEVSFISQNLKNIARELKVPVLALSQLSRAIEHRGEKKPQLADLRESGCLAGSTLITNADTGERVPIKELVGKTGFKTWGMSPDMKIRTQTAVNIFNSGRKKLFTMRLRSGRTIQATANHKFRLLTDWRRLDQLKIGDRIATPRQIHQPLKDNKNFSDESLVLLAHMLGDGCYVERQPIHYTSASKSHIALVENAAHAQFNIQGRIVQQDSWYHVYLPSPYPVARGNRHPMMKWFESLGLGFSRSHEKVVPEKIFSCSERQIGLFLSHLWATDGSIHIGKSNVRIYYATSSSVLALQVQSLLLRLGIQSYVKEVPQNKKGNKYRSMFSVDVQGAYFQILFLQRVGGVGDRETPAQKALAILSAKTQNPNLDIVGKEIWRDIIELEKQKARISWRKFSEMLGMSYCGSTLFASGVGRSRLAKIADILDSEIVRRYAHSDIYWEEVVGIEPGEIEDVYDMTIDTTHNFIAGDIVVHNSIEQDADVVMFLYGQDNADELVDDTKRMVKLYIAKHRNGATGEIDLMFRGDRVKFYGVDKKGGL